MNIYINCLVLLVSFFFPAAFADTKTVNDGLSENMKYVALAHAIYKDGVQKVPEWAVNQLVVEQSIDLLKSSISSERPDGTDDDSFPSGHTGKAFAPAWFIYRNYGAKEAAPYFIAASYVGYARVKLDRHRPIDVAASVALSYVVSRVFTGSDPTISIDVGDGFRVHMAKAI